MAQGKIEFDTPDVEETLRAEISNRYVHCTAGHTVVIMALVVTSKVIIVLDFSLVLLFFNSL